MTVPHGTAGGTPIPIGFLPFSGCGTGGTPLHLSHGTLESGTPGTLGTSGTDGTSGTPGTGNAP